LREGRTADLARLWLAEVRPGDAEAIVAVPALERVLPALDPDGVTALAVEYQRLLGFGVPPYESVFVDPSAMLLAPATARVAASYRQAGWEPPRDARAAAEDHLGLELLAWGECLADGRGDEAVFFLMRHLALWVPAFALSFGSLDPHPFYRALAEVTVEAVLGGLPPGALPEGSDPFPELPPPPVYLASDPPAERHRRHEAPDGPGLGDIVGRLLVPREAGLYLSREDILRAGRSADLPVGLGERRQMLGALLRLAGQYEALDPLLAALDAPFAAAERYCADLAARHPAWAGYGAAWRGRLSATRALLASLRDEARRGA